MLWYKQLLFLTSGNASQGLPERALFSYNFLTIERERLFVANDALKTFKLVLHECLVALNDFLVTSLTCRFCMLAIKFEPCFIVVELFYLPAFIAMAFSAIRYAKLFELALVLVLVTTGTGGGQTGKFPMFEARLRFVAVAAGCSAVCAL